MGVVIDSNILIDVERGGSSISRLVTDLSDSIYISAVTASELLVGVHFARSDELRERRSAFVELILSTIPVLSVGVDVARVHARIFAEVGRAGVSIGVHDSWIAATCIAHSHRLMTRNIREFGRLPELTLIEL